LEQHGVERREVAQADNEVEQVFVILALRVQPRVCYSFSEK
jgi:hypothetical protein